VLPFESVYKKIIIVYIIKNFESYMDMKKAGMVIQIHTNDILKVTYQRIINFDVGWAGETYVKSSTQYSFFILFFFISLFFFLY
jgi:hypothetical protein